jgi:prepilin-type N-terminal cleavage/methylation domain-containing protein
MLEPNKKQGGDNLKTRAFTLIELLIVVAIIAILAAIAVPNFLEAQTRSKVSRTRADMRTIATGLESYRVDSNGYPPAADWWTSDTNVNYANVNGQEFHAKMPNFLTTPIAYLTSIFEDPFIVGRAAAAVTRYNAQSRVYFRYTYFNYHDFVSTFPTSATNKAQVEQTGGWYYYSFGPDKHPNFAGFETGDANKAGSNRVWTRYDPTNGTISLGNIIRTQRSPEGQIPFNAGNTTATNGPN